MRIKFRACSTGSNLQGYQVKRRGDTADENMPNNQLPPHGRNWEEVKALMEATQKDDLPWYSERMFIGGSYFGGEDVVEVANEAYQMYINYNGLYATKVFPSLVRYESDIVGALLEMMNASVGARVVASPPAAPRA